MARDTVGTRTHPVPTLWNSPVVGGEGDTNTQMIIHVIEHSRGKCYEGTGRLRVSIVVGQGAVGRLPRGSEDLAGKDE